MPRDELAHLRKRDKKAALFNPLRGLDVAERAFADLHPGRYIEYLLDCWICLHTREKIEFLRALSIASIDPTNRPLYDPERCCYLEPASRSDTRKALTICQHAFRELSPVHHQEFLLGCFYSFHDRCKIHFLDSIAYSIGLNVPGLLERAERYPFLGRGVDSLPNIQALAAKLADALSR